ncbi:hypothetical protein CKAN_00548800 [Cinnamomum micranthum f. kanehirae]|uniref:Uncharacterized protein n=1 Tax=Cinnamomum micranthum f. kanehirae TaxID=337451 RepID=A0A3S3Q0G2_9MAGN|nr:hypothetical protein CKAN_00548800 [Cinnamomum micranthum f. kanehirae]
MNILANQARIQAGGDLNMALSWAPNQTGHHHLWHQLGGRVTQNAPLYPLWEKELTSSDVSGQQARFVFTREIVENSIVRCLTSQQRDDLLNNGEAIQVAGFDEGGRRWELTLLKRTQRSNPNGTYILTGAWVGMVNANGWRTGNVIKIWGLPYAGMEDQWRFEPDNDFGDITLVFSTTV